MALRRFATEVVDRVRQAPWLEGRAVQTDKASAYIPRGAAIGIAFAAVAGVTYDHRTQLNTVKEMMISEMQCLEVRLAAAEKTLSKDIEILKQDVKELKGGVKAILKNLDAKGK